MVINNTIATILLSIVFGVKSFGQLSPSKVLSSSIEAHFVDFGILGKRICIADKYEKVIKVLNSNYTVYKIIKIPFNQGYEIPIVSCLSDNLFNSDTLIEFVCQYNRNSDPKSEKGKFVVYNEEGRKIIETIGYHYEFQNIDNKSKLLVSDMYVNQEVKIYDLNSVFSGQNVFWGTYRFPK